MNTRTELRNRVGLDRIQKWTQQYVEKYFPNRKTGATQLASEANLWGVSLTNTISKKFLSTEDHPRYPSKTFFLDSRVRREAIAIAAVFYARGIIEKKDISELMNLPPFVMPDSEWQDLTTEEWKFFEEGFVKWKRLYEPTHHGLQKETTVATRESEWFRRFKNLVKAKPILFLFILFTLIMSFVVFIAVRGFLKNESIAYWNGTENQLWEVFERDFDGVAMVLVPTGCFIMGNDNDRENQRQAHRQCVDHPFWIDKTEVTNGQYGISSSEDQPGCNVAAGGINIGTPTTLPDNDYPRNCVNWIEAASFCESRGKRLASELEWEYAARGVSSWLYPWGMTFEPERALVIVGADAPGRAYPVGHYPQGASWVGAYDMAGSLWEWTSTIFAPYRYDPQDGRESTQNSGNLEERSSTVRVLRGGSWDNPFDRASTAFRGQGMYDVRFNSFGFRCVRDYQVGDL